MKVTTFLSFVCVFSLFAENTFAGEKAAMKDFVVSGNGERENAEKAYNLTFQDGVNANRNGADFKVEKKTVSRGDILNIHMYKGGGWAAILSPKK